MKRLTVFCGSNIGARPEYLHAAHELGRLLAHRKIGLVYGGSGIGIMRELAGAVLEAGGEVVGVIPQLLVDREVAYKVLPDLRVVVSMHERKALMADLGDAFIAMPGGLGTLDEFFEIVSWAQLGMHQKPCGLLNVCGYYDRLVGFLDHAVDQQFIKPQYRLMIQVDDTVQGLLNKLEQRL
jgi:uncharacterized protein (TIGR00730 family)